MMFLLQVLQVLVVAAPLLLILTSRSGSGGLLLAAAAENDAVIELQLIQVLSELSLITDIQTVRANDIYSLFVVFVINRKMLLV